MYFCTYNYNINAFSFCCTNYIITNLLYIYYIIHICIYYICIYKLKNLINLNDIKIIKYIYFVQAVNIFIWDTLKYQFQKSKT